MTKLPNDMEEARKIVAALRERVAQPDGWVEADLNLSAADVLEELLLAASPVVPVGVSREEIARIIGHAITAYENDPAPDCWTARANACGSGADAIIAALRPTDTGRE